MALQKIQKVLSWSSFCKNWTTSERFKFFSFVIFINILLVGFSVFVPVRPDLRKRKSFQLCCDWLKLVGEVSNFIFHFFLG